MTRTFVRVCIATVVATGGPPGADWELTNEGARVQPLLVYMTPTTYLAGIAATTTLSSTDLRGLRLQLVADAGAALGTLLVATVLSVYKPRGMTPYGRRQARAASHA